ncbi:MAG: hypothetical protein WDN28_12695 [Chthoniobacter sp.]
MACGLQAGQYAKATTGAIVFPGQITARNGGSITSPYGRNFANWSRPVLIEFAVHPDLGNNVVNGAIWQAIWGRANADAAAPATILDSDEIMGVEFVSTTAGVVDVYGLGSNGSHATTTAKLCTISTGGYSTIQLYSDGNGNLTVTVNGTSYQAPNILPAAKIVQFGAKWSFETLNSGAADSPYYYFYWSDTDISFQ